MLLTLTTAAAIIAATLTGAPSAAPPSQTPAPIIQPVLRPAAVSVPSSSPLTIKRAVVRSTAPQLTVAPVAVAARGKPLEAEHAPASGTGSGGAIVNQARQHLGVPYVWGGTTTRGFDCSGLIQYVMRDLGVSMPRVAGAQATVGIRIPNLAQAQPGDLLGMRNGTHIAIYLGDNRILHAPRPGENVSIRSLGVWDDIDVIRRVGVGR